MSWLRFGRLGSILARNALKSVSVLPIFSPRPLNAVAIAPRVWLSLTGSILSKHRDELLEDGVDLDHDVLALNHLSPMQFLRRGVRRRLQLDELGAEHRRRRDVDSHVGRDEVQLRVDPSPGGWRPCRRAATRSTTTLPTSTPRIFTLASGFITRPARSEITVTGTVLVKVSAEQHRRQARRSRPIATTVARPASGRTYCSFRQLPPLSRQVEVAVGAVDGQ